MTHLRFTFTRIPGIFGRRRRPGRILTGIPLGHPEMYTSLTGKERARWQQIADDVLADVALAMREQEEGQ